MRRKTVVLAHWPMLPTPRDAADAVIGTDTCQVDHIGYCLAGRMAVQLEDGTVTEFGPGAVVHIPAGHDAWTSGDEACVFVDFGGLRGYAVTGQ